MNDEEIFKEDPLTKPKKITVAALVSALAILAVSTFASFHWICVDYFRFKENEGDARKQLEEIRVRCADEEKAVRKHLAAIEEESKASEEQARQRAKTSEADAQKRIKELEKEYSDKRAEKMAEHQKLVNELDESIKTKKNDIAVLLRGFKERYDARTNDLEMAIASKNAALLEIEHMISLMPDIKGQLLVESNALVVARAQRDVALKDERAAQEGYGKWNAKIESAKAELDELTGRKGKLEAELESLSQNTNAVGLAIVALQGQVKTLQTKVAAAQESLQSIQGDIEAATSKLEGVRSRIADVEVKFKTAESARAHAEDEMSAALDKKREAESRRDKAIFEAAEAEAHLEKRKLEIEGLLKDMEQVLKMKSQAIKPVDEIEEGVVVE